MNKKAIAGAAFLGAAVTAIGGYIAFDYMKAQEAEHADRLMRAEIVCESMKEDVSELAIRAFRWGLDRDDHDTPEAWRETGETLHAPLIESIAKDEGRESDVVAVVKAMIPYNREINRGLVRANASDPVLWQVGRKVCIKLEMNR